MAFLKARSHEVEPVEYSFLDGYEYIEINGYFVGGARFSQVVPVKWTEGTGMSLERALCYAIGDGIECNFQRIASKNGWINADWTVVGIGNFGV